MNIKRSMMTRKIGLADDDDSDSDDSGSPSLASNLDDVVAAGVDIDGTAAAVAADGRLDEGTSSSWTWGSSCFDLDSFSLVFLDGVAANEWLDFWIGGTKK